MEEEDLSVSLVLDVSGSMDYGDPNKLLYAKRMVAALGYVALTHYNRLNLYSFSDTVLEQRTGMRGRRPVPEMLSFLEKQRPGATGAARGDLTAACKRLSAVQQKPGIVVLVSDFFEKGDVSAALKYLAGERYDGYAVQLLSPQEADPTKGGVTGDLRLTDLEDGDTGGGVGVYGAVGQVQSELGSVLPECAGGVHEAWSDVSGGDDGCAGGACGVDVSARAGVVGMRFLFSEDRGTLNRQDAKKMRAAGDVFCLPWRSWRLDGLFNCLRFKTGGSE